VCSAGSGRVQAAGERSVLLWARHGSGRPPKLVSGGGSQWSVDGFINVFPCDVPCDRGKKSHPPGLASRSATAGTMVRAAAIRGDPQTLSESKPGGEVVAARHLPLFGAVIVPEPYPIRRSPCKGKRHPPGGTGFVLSTSARYPGADPIPASAPGSTVLPGTGLLWIRDRLLRRRTDSIPAPIERRYAFRAFSVTYSRHNGRRGPSGRGDSLTSFDMMEEASDDEEQSW